MRRLKPVLDFRNYQPDMNAALDPSSAQLHLWLAQMHRDHNNISDHHMEQLEIGLDTMAKKSITIYNPLTGELRRIPKITKD